MFPWFYLEAALQQQVSHPVGVLVQLSEGPPLPGPLEDQRRLVAVPPHRFGEDLGDGVLLPEVAFDVHLHPQQHIRRTEVQEENTGLYSLFTPVLYVFAIQPEVAHPLISLFTVAGFIPSMLLKFK